MPKLDGLRCSAGCAGADRTPVPLLTARSEIDDRVTGSTAAAND